jgi:hypothetical protein
MEQEELETIYRSWDDEKLMSAFANRGDYTDIALRAMQTIINERHLGDEVKSILDTEVKNEIEIQEYLVKKQLAYEAEILGENLSAKELVKKCQIESSVYLSRALTTNQTLVLRIVLFGLSIAGITCFIIALATGIPLFYAPLYFLIPSVLFLLIAIKLHLDSKSHLELKKEGRKTIMHIQHQNFNYHATVPFRYFVFWTKIEDRNGRMKVTHHMLSLVITNDRNESISLQGHLSALQKPPPLWPEGTNQLVPAGAKFFTESGFKRSDIIRLKKILDGLHEIHNEN